MGLGRWLRRLGRRGRAPVVETRFTRGGRNTVNFDILPGQGIPITAIGWPPPPVAPLATRAPALTPFPDLAPSTPVAAPGGPLQSPPAISPAQVQPAPPPAPPSPAPAPPSQPGPGAPERRAPAPVAETTPGPEESPDLGGRVALWYEDGTGLVLDDAHPLAQEFIRAADRMMRPARWSKVKRTRSGSRER